jgi:predicted nuclease with TOPRIM domain
MEDINSLLDAYDPGKPDKKPDVTKQLAEIRENREKMMKEHMEKQLQYQDTMNKLNMMNNPQAVQDKINEQSFIIQQLSNENDQLQDKVKYLEDKIKQLINEKIQERLKDKQNQLSSK